METAVHVQHFAGHPARHVREEEQTGIAHFVLIGGAVLLWQQGAATAGDIAASGAIALRIAQMSGWVSFTLMSIYTSVGEVEVGLGERPTTIIYTPNPEFSGTAVIDYWLGDLTSITGDASRQRKASVTVTVIGRPNAPERVTPTVDDQAGVRVDWVDGASNGSRIVEYEVRSTDGDVRASNCAKPCVVTPKNGIIPGQMYQFVVLARNEINWSAPSEPNGFDVTPDALPPPVTVRKVSENKESVDFAWDPPSKGDYSEVTGYLVEGFRSNPDDPSTSIRIPGPATVPICIRVVAVNKQGSRAFDGEPICMTPYGDPEVSASAVRERGEGDVNVRLRWTADGKGRQLQPFQFAGDGCEQRAVEEGEGWATGEATFRCRPGTRSITVTATTTGEGASTTETATVEAYDAPVIQTAPTFTPGPGLVRVALPADVEWNREGPARRFWRYSWSGPNGLGSDGELGDGDSVIEGLPAWSDVSISISACNADDSCSDPSVSSSSTWGFPNAPVDARAGWLSPTQFELSFAWSQGDSTTTAHEVKLSSSKGTSPAVVGSIAVVDGSNTFTFDAGGMVDSEDWTLVVTVCESPSVVSPRKPECSTTAAAVLPRAPDG